MEFKGEFTVQDVSDEIEGDLAPRSVQAAWNTEDGGGTLKVFVPEGQPVPAVGDVIHVSGFTKATGDNGLPVGLEGVERTSLT